MKKLFLILSLSALLLGACQNIPPENEKAESFLNRKVYVAVENENKIAIVDPLAGTVIKEIELPGMPHNVQVAPDGATVWVTVNTMHEDEMDHGEGSMEDQLVVISTEIDVIVSTIELGADLHLAHVVLSPDNQWAYTPSQETDTLFVVDAQDHSLERTIPLPANAEPHGLRLSPDGNMAYIALMGSNGMGVLDLNSDHYEFVDFGDVTVQTGVTPDGNYAFASLYSTKQLGVYNTQTKEISTVSLPEAKGPVQVYPTPDSRYAFVADQGYYFDQPTSDKVYKIDLETKEVVLTITAGQGPHGVALSSDGKEAYVTNLVSGDLSVIDIETGAITRTIPVGEAPNGVSVWEGSFEETSLKPVDSISHPHGLSVDLLDPNKVYIATHQGLLVLENEGLYRLGESQDDLMGFTVDLKYPKTFYSSGHPSSGGNIGFQKSTDGGTTWEKISDGIDGPVDFHSLAVSSQNSDLIYGWYHGTLQRSTDGGSNWSVLDSGLKDVIALNASSSQEGALYAATMSGQLVSKDKGETWSVLSEDLSGSIVVAFTVNPSDPSHMLSFSDSLGLAKSNDGGASWASIPSEFTQDYPTFIAYAPSDSSLLYLITKANLLYKSTDGGETWSKLNY